MTADIAASGYLVDGNDLAVDGVELTHDGAGLWSGLSEDVGTDTFPGADGGDITDGRFLPYTHSTMYKLRAATQETAWAGIVALRRRCKPGRTVTLTRRMPDPDGTDANTLHTTTARRLTDRPAWLGKRGLVVDIDWWVTEPWHGPSTNIASGAGTHTILGDTRTYRMTITLAAGAQRTVSNNTNGYFVQFYATVPSGGVLIDVEARTATAITSGTDMSQYLVWPKNLPFRLEPGANVLSTDVASFSVDYQPAYL